MPHDYLLCGNGNSDYFCSKGPGRFSAQLTLSFSTSNGSCWLSVWWKLTSMRLKKTYHLTKPLINVQRTAVNHWKSSIYHEIVFSFSCFCLFVVGNRSILLGNYTNKFNKCTYISLFCKDVAEIITRCSAAILKQTEAWIKVMSWLCGHLNVHLSSIVSLCIRTKGK